MLKLNNVPVIPTMFPDGTSQVWKLDKNIISGEENTITWEFENEGELIHLVQLKHLLDSMTFYSTQSYLNVPYFPYARQDKEISNGSTFALRSFCSVLSGLDFSGILTLDIHSPIASSLLKNIVSSFPKDVLDGILATWNGENRLGKVLDNVRDTILGEK